MRSLLESKGVKRDDSPSFGPAGYSVDGKRWLVMDEDQSLQDTNHLIEDCVDNENYEVAQIIKDLADQEEQALSKKTQ